MSLLPGAGAFRHDGGSVGVVLCHGFTGSPRSMRPWADHLAAAGMTVRLPLLPGHGTTWQDMNLTTSDQWLATAEEALQDLRGRCDEVFVMGLSMGGCLALRLAQLHPGAVSGIVVVNPSIAVENRGLHVAPLLKHVLRSTRGLTNDIKRPGVDEHGYDRVPLAAAATLPRLWRATRRGLASITAPILAYRSSEDHVIGPASMRILTEGAVNTTVTVVTLENSYHVATLDHDAQTVFEGSLAFVRGHSRSGEGTAA
ncbi:alpha/beta hydrolase [Marinactinospora thermotolerans]|uniref:Carboxylesterase n=1 Tax=Marinactinospora thermotolerans DSM 45154 TaxID=1122192 RepID=A0A1T4MFA7_9ACTN|nr:alpha/beta fold hydrolase [Marinactinospora thermotolerans]SJZ65547.1 carboxylesterase [Marinactinospora thermotolerans DSM 45154]